LLSSLTIIALIGLILYLKLITPTVPLKGENIVEQPEKTAVDEAELIEVREPRAKISQEFLIREEPVEKPEEKFQADIGDQTAQPCGSVMSSTTPVLYDRSSGEITYAGEDDFPNLEKIEEECLAIMHRMGWYKPEDVPITWAPPPSTSPPPGVYIWWEVVGEGTPRKPPPHVEERSRELGEEIKRAAERGDARRMIELVKELRELNRPYKGEKTKIRMLCKDIPPSWKDYFIKLAFELSALEEVGK